MAIKDKPILIATMHDNHQHLALHLTYSTPSAPIVFLAWRAWNGWLRLALEQDKPVDPVLS
jgi:hypothetical protein